jgi:glucosamine--fructose-6-phosphate aminotransferase (isomerizing)
MDELPVDYVPELRKQPPWLMEEMIASEPSLVEPILGATSEAHLIAELIRKAVLEKSPVVVTGCGTSETAAMAIADLVAGGLKRSGINGALVHARQALEASLDPWPGGVCIGISHDGSTRATILAMEAARNAGALVALITARPEGPAIPVVDAVFVTPRIDRSWCHTVGYLSPILAGAAIAQALDQRPVDATGLKNVLDDVIGVAPHAPSLAKALFGVDRLIIVGAAPDRSPARELALKIEEGVWLPARMLDLETVFHGHLAGADQRTGMVIVATGAADRVTARTKLLIGAARAIGIRVGAIVSPAVDQSFGSDRNLSRMVLPKSIEGFGLIGRLAGAALALQQLTVALSRLAGTNPDQIRRQQPAYKDAARVAESSSNW